MKNLVHLEISDKFSVFYRIIDFYAFFQTVAKRDLICRTIVYVYFILCMIARPKRFIKPKIMLMKSKLKTILIFVFQQIHFVFGHFRLELCKAVSDTIWIKEKRMSPQIVLSGEAVLRFDEKRFGQRFSAPSPSVSVMSPKHQ